MRSTREPRTAVFQWIRFFALAMILALTGCGGGGGGGGGDEPSPAPSTTYTVSFNGDGAENTFASQDVLEGATVTNPGNARRTGYNFTGWFNGETPWNFSTDTVTSNITLTAHWETARHTVSFNANGANNAASLSLGAQTVDYGRPVDNPGAAVKAGASGEPFTFNGWFANRCEGSAWDFTTSTVSSDITLIACWNTVTVTFDAKGGSNVSSKEIEAGTVVDRPNNPTRSGYTFVNWFADDSSTSPWDFSAKITKNITLVARWNADSSGGGGSTTPPTPFIVSYVVDNTNGGSGTVANGSVLPGNAATVSGFDGTGNPTAPTDTTFYKWNTQADGRGTWYAPAASIPNVRANITLYAIYDGDGTSATYPKLIGVGVDAAADATAFADIATDATSLAGHYRLVKNIDLTSQDPWTPIGDGTTAFSGSLDGNGYTVSKLNVTNATTAGTFAGLFGSVAGTSAVIKNLTVVGEVTTDDGTSVGLIAGKLDGGAKIMNVSASGTVSGDNATAALSVGGIVGTVDGASEVTNSYFVSSGTGVVADDASTANTDNIVAGGIAGTVTDGKISFCYVNANVSATGSTAKNYAGGVVGETGASATVENTVALGDGATTEVVGADAAGRIVGEKDSGSTLTNNFGEATIQVNSAVATGATVAADGKDGADVTLAATKDIAWWKAATNAVPPGPAFVTGTTEASPWKQSLNAEKRPVLWWE